MKNFLNIQNNSEKIYTNDEFDQLNNALSSTIFDIAVENVDTVFLNKAFEIIEYVPIHIINRIVTKSILINRESIMKAIIF